MFTEGTQYDAQVINHPGEFALHQAMFRLH